jgi:hypothetical protein
MMMAALTPVHRHRRIRSQVQAGVYTLQRGKSAEEAERALHEGHVVFRLRYRISFIQTYLYPIQLQTGIEIEGRHTRRQTREKQESAQHDDEEVSAFQEREPCFDCAFPTQARDCQLPLWRLSIISSNLIWDSEWWDSC